MEMNCLLSISRSYRTNRNRSGVLRNMYWRCGWKVFRPILLLSFLLLPVRPVAAQSYDTFLEPNQTINISSPFRDRIALVHVEEGDRVKAGQLLAELDTRMLKARLASAEEAVAAHGRIDSARALATMQTNRQKMLLDLEKSGNARPQEMITAETDLTMAKSQLQNALDEQLLKKSEVKIIEAQIEEKKLRSPVDGVVVKIFKKQFELIGENDQQPLLTVVQLDPLQALFHLPPGEAAQLKAGQAVSLTAGETKAAGVVHYVAPVINAQSGTVEVRVHVPNPDSKLVSGSRCNLILSNPTGEIPHEK
jgi:RND family efflux transporter MFP subunit